MIVVYGITIRMITNLEDACNALHNPKFKQKDFSYPHSDTFYVREALRLRTGKVYDLEHIDTLIKEYT